MTGRTTKRPGVADDSRGPERTAKSTATPELELGRNLATNRTTASRPGEPKTGFSERVVRHLETGLLAGETPSAKIPPRL